MKVEKSMVVAFAIVAIAIVVSILALQFMVNKIFNINAMLFTKLIPFIKKWEGGLSRDPKDSASNNPAPWTYKEKTGWHTNKGITYTAFSSNASRLGYAPTADNFFNMPDAIWIKILNGAYMKAFPLDQINHLPRIQAVIITWVWGSGVSGGIKRLADFQREVMGVNDSNITATELVANFKVKVNVTNEHEWFVKLCDRREADFRKMATFNVHGNGWINRLNDFRTLFN